MIVACNGTTVIDPLTRLTLDQVLASGPIATNKQMGLAGSSNLSFGDNCKAQFGNNNTQSGDLQIFHDGSHSYIKDIGTGDLKLLGANSVRTQNADGSKDYIVARTGGGTDNLEGSVSVSYNGVEKLRTVSAGTTTFGTVNASSYNAGAGKFSISTDNTVVTWTSGSGSPEGAITANVGSIYSRTDSTTYNLYSKSSGSGNTGWKKVVAINP